VLAVRDRTSFRMAVRNIPRRPMQTALILLGLMLATLLFSAAFTTGDTLTKSLRTQALENIGRVDVVVKSEQPESGGGIPFGPGAGVREAPEARERYFDQDLAGKIRNRLSGVGSVAGVAPLARETVPVTSQTTDLSEPGVDVLGMDADSMNGFDALKAASGRSLSVGDLKKNEVYVSQETAEGLGIGLGDKVEASLVRPAMEPKSEKPSGPDSQRRSGTAQGPPGGPGTGTPPAVFGSGARPQRAVVDGRPAASSAEMSPAGPRRVQRPPALKVAGIYESGANPASETSMVMTLGALQKLLGEEDTINEVLVTHRGPAVEGGRYTKETVDEIKPGKEGRRG
jgi:putative ABC transport system permease protein